MPVEILAIANQKGGVGKTTTAINLATCMAAVGKSVLLVDFDPQGSASTGLGIARKSRIPGAFELLIDSVPLPEAVRNSAIKGLDILPATQDLAGFETEMQKSSRNPRFVLREALKDKADCYDFVLIDCPPALGMLTVNALVAASKVLVPLQVEFFALEGLSSLIKTIENVKLSLNPQLALFAILLTMYDSRTRLSHDIKVDVERHFKNWLLSAVIPRNVRLSEAPAYGKPITLYDPLSTGAKAYIDAAAEILSKLKARNA